MEIKSCLTHIHTHTAESWIAVSLLLCFFDAPSHHHRCNKYEAELPQQRLTNQSTPTTNLTPLREPLPPTGRQGAPLPPNRVETMARRAPFPSHGSPEPQNTLLY